MRVAPLAYRARLAGLGAGAALAAAAVLVVAGPAATAAPAGPSSPGPSSAASSSSASSSSSSSSSVSASTKPTRKPAATAPPLPSDDGPPCTTHAQAHYPVICLPAGFDEDKAASLTPGSDVEFAGQVVNNGPDVTNANVVITLPQGLQLDSDDGDPVSRVDNWYSEDADKSDYADLTCHGGPTTVTCSVGELKTHANILIVLDLELAADATAGSALSFQVALQPVGTPVYTSTLVSATIDVLAPSHLEVSLTPATLRTVVGHRARMTGIVHNAGAGAAPDAVAVAITVDLKHPKRTHFTITNGSKLTDPTGNGSSDSAVPVPGVGETTVLFVGNSSDSPQRTRLELRTLARHADSAQRHGMPSLAFWPIGTIAPGATRTVPIELTALTAGTDTLAFGAISDSDESDCTEEESGGGSSSGSDSGSESSAAPAGALDRVAAAASTTAAPAACSFLVTTHITAIPAPAALANSGTHQLDLQLGIALWALVLGSLLVWAGRRRASGRRHA